jgi:hypothetical protein
MSLSILFVLNLILLSLCYILYYFYQVLIDFSIFIIAILLSILYKYIMLNNLMSHQLLIILDLILFIMDFYQFYSLQ